MAVDAVEWTAVAEAVVRFDAAVDRAFVRPRTSRAATRAMVLLANIGVTSAVWLAMCGLGFAVSSGRRTFWAQLAVGVFAEWVITNGPVKSVARRPRPERPVDGAWTTGLQKPSTSSFPSGHSSAAGFVAVATFAVTPWWPAILVLGVAMCANRVFLRLHHASDVLAGVLWGAGLAVVLRALI